MVSNGGADKLEAQSAGCRTSSAISKLLGEILDYERLADRLKKN